MDKIWERVCFSLDVVTEKYFSLIFQAFNIKQNRFFFPPIYSIERKTLSPEVMEQV